MGTWEAKQQFQTCMTFLFVFGFHEIWCFLKKMFSATRKKNSSVVIKMHEKDLPPEDQAGPRRSRKNEMPMKLKFVFQTSAFIKILFFSQKITKLAKWHQIRPLMRNIYLLLSLLLIPHKQQISAK